MPHLQAFQRFVAKTRQIFLIATVSVGLFTLSGCASSVQFEGAKLNAGQPTNPNLTTEQQQSIAELSAAILEMGGPNNPIDPVEAQKVAYDAHVYPMVLANEFNLMSPPLYHNYLVNKGDRQRGLCFHWAHDLINYFRAQNLETIDLHWAVGFPKNALREHNSLVVTARGEGIAQGILLDPWRNSATLLWMPVIEDKKYPWELIESYTQGPTTQYIVDTYKRTM